MCLLASFQWCHPLQLFFKARVSALSSWHVNIFMYRYFNNPDPPLRLVQDSISSLLSGVHKSLKAGILRQRTIRIPFPMYIFKYLFNNKGSRVPHKPGRFGDFWTNHFKTEDFVYYNQAGEGCEVTFPVYMNCHIRWSSRSYDRFHQLLPTRDYVETLTVFLTKGRLHWNVVTGVVTMLWYLLN